MGHGLGRPGRGGGDDQQDRYSTLTKPYSEATAALIDADVQRLLDDAHKRACNILTASRLELDRLAEVLLKSETVYSEGLIKILGPQPAAGPDTEAVRAGWESTAGNFALRNQRPEFRRILLNSDY